MLCMKYDAQIPMYTHSLHIYDIAATYFMQSVYGQATAGAFLTSVSPWHFKRADVATNKNLCLQRANCYYLFTD